MVLDVITISRRQPRLRYPERGENNISIRSGFIRLRIHARGIREKCARFLSTSRKTLLTAIAVKKVVGEGRKKAIVPRSQREKQPCLPHYREL